MPMGNIISKLDLYDLFARGVIVLCIAKNYAGIEKEEKSK